MSSHCGQIRSPEKARQRSLSFGRGIFLRSSPARRVLRFGTARQTCFCRAFQACIRKATSALAAGHRRAPVSCRAYLCPPLRSGLRASGLQRRQGARSLRDRQPPTALPALDRTSTRRHRANNRPKGHSGPSACKFHLCQAPFSLKVDGFWGNSWKSSTLRFACFEKVDGFWGNSRKSSTLHFASFEKVDGVRGNNWKSSTLIFSALKKSMDFEEMDENHRLCVLSP